MPIGLVCLCFREREKVVAVGGKGNVHRVLLLSLLVLPWAKERFICTLRSFAGLCSAAAEVGVHHACLVNVVHGLTGWVSPIKKPNPGLFLVGWLVLFFWGLCVCVLVFLGGGVFVCFLVFFSIGVQQNKLSLLAKPAKLDRARDEGCSGRVTGKTTLWLTEAARPWGSSHDGTDVMSYYTIQYKPKQQISFRSCVSAWLPTWGKHPSLDGL